MNTMTLEQVQALAEGWLVKLQGWLTSPQFYAQVLIVIAAWAISRVATRQIGRASCRERVS
jgi:hypothetical protein